MKEICGALDIEKLRTTSYKPSTNGCVERFHRSLNSLLAKVVSNNQRDWDEWLPSVLAAYHASTHESTGYTPNFLMFGREVRVPLDLAYCDPEIWRENPRYCDFVETRLEKMRDSFEHAREQLGVSATRSKSHYDMKVRPVEYKPGEWVWYFNPRRYVGKSPKWQSMFTGPYLIVHRLGEVNFVIQSSQRSTKYSSSHRQIEAML